MNDKHAHNGDGHAADIQPEQLTAFALGQLSGDEQAAVEQWLALPEQTQARQAVAEMRRLADVLPGALTAGCDFKPSASLREAVLQKLADVEGQKVERPAKPQSAKSQAEKRWPRIIRWSLVGGVLCLVVGLAIPAVQTARQAAQRANSGNNLSQSLQGRESAERRLNSANAVRKELEAAATERRMFTYEEGRPTADLAVEPLTGPVSSYPRSKDEFDTLIPQIELPSDAAASTTSAASLSSGLVAGGSRLNGRTPSQGEIDAARAASSTAQENVHELRARVAASASTKSPMPAAYGSSGMASSPSFSGDRSRVARVPSGDPRSKIAVTELATAVTEAEPHAIQRHNPPITLHNGQSPDAGIQVYARTEGQAREQYEPIVENRFLGPMEHPLSTFSIDVDTASYSNVRRFLTGGQLPPPNAVRIEELVNYFSYDYPQPKGREPFSVNMETAECPWQPGHLLLRVGLKGKEIHRAERPPSNLVFLLDVSGSMSDANKLPLLQQALMFLVRELTENDRVSIVTYAGEAGLRLPPTRGDMEGKVVMLKSIATLSAGGSTNGSAGIELAYEQAGQYFLKEGANRVILATDGDLNVGVTSDSALVELIKSKAAAGTFLTVLGFGEGNLQDAKLEKLADNGNGQYAYIDSVREARKVLVEELSGSTVTIAKDVKIQIEFNPAQIASYRLLGYENRVLAAKDFNDDKKDAGEIGAGHSVTALYELVPAGAKEAAAAPVEGEPLKYQKTEASRKRELPDDAPLTNAATSGELLTLKLRYKEPDGVESRMIEFPLSDLGGKFNAASKDLQFASAVVSFGMILRGSEQKGSGNLAAVLEIASGSLGEDKSGYRAEFVDLVRRAQSLGAK